MEETFDTEERERENGRVLFIKREGKLLSLLYAGNKLLRAHVYVPETDVLHNIYIGKVKHIAENIQAAFVEYMPGALCFLPLREYREPIVTNRVYDGRIVAGDEIVLQISSESQKNKEAGATANLSFAGEFLVLTTGRHGIGYSSKLSEEQRAMLKESAEKSIAFAEVQKECGILFRTKAGELTDCSILERELQTLREQADTVRRSALHRTPFTLLQKAPAAYLKSLREFLDIGYDKILTDDPAVFQETESYLARSMPGSLEKLVFYEDALLPLHKLYSVEARLEEALGRKVWLKSGGYLVIDKTEALTCIDVNSGKYIGKKSKAETFLHINLEAAEEIGRQLQLRNLSGIIIIDFINMDTAQQNRELMKSLRRILSRDPVRAAAVDMTPLGLVEVTRKKVRRPLWEQLR